MGARVGRSIALSLLPDSGSQYHPRFTEFKGCAEFRGQQAASLKSVLSFCLLDRTVVGLRQGLSLNNCRADIAPTIHFLIVSCADGSYYIEVWDESKFERQHT